jgi:hypothetical protein
VVNYSTVFLNEAGTNDGSFPTHTIISAGRSSEGVNAAWVHHHEWTTRSLSRSTLRRCDR